MICGIHGPKFCKVLRSKHLLANADPNPNPIITFIVKCCTRVYTLGIYHNS